MKGKIVVGLSAYVAITIMKVSFQQFLYITHNESLEPYECQVGFECKNVILNSHVN